MKNCKDCGEEFKGLSPRALAHREYCASCAAERRKRRQKEYIRRTKYNARYARKLYRWKKETHPPDDKKERICLVHGGLFKSTGPGNRICPRCRKGSADMDYELVPKKVFVRQGVESRS